MANALTELRARNERRCSHILDRSELLGTSDLDWDGVPETTLDDDVLATLVYMRDVEGFTTRDFVGLSDHPATWADPLVARFLPIWRAEEAEHARALDRFLVTYGDAHGVAVPPIQPPPPARLCLSERLTMIATRPIGHVVTAAHMAWGATNELLTMNGYRLLARRSGHPVLAELCTRISAQESRHYSFYNLQTEWRLAASGLARRAVRTLLTRTWTPVGVGADYKAPEEFDRVLATLLHSPAGAAAVDRMDATVSALPGLGRLVLYRSMVDGALGRPRASATA